MKIRHPSSVWIVPLAICVIGWLGWFLLRQHEPTYEGKTLGYWLRHEYQWDGPSDEGKVAIKKMGTNALPALLKMASAKDPVVKRKTIEMLGRIEVHFNQEIFPSFHTDQELHVLSSWGFAALGPVGKPAVPDLIRLLGDQDYQLQLAGLACLSGIGPSASPAVPDLVRLLRSTNRDVQMSAMNCLGSIGPAAEKSVPALLPFVTNTDSRVRTHSMWALYSVHAQPTVIKSALLAAVNTNPQDQRTVSYALTLFAKLGADAKVTVPLVLPMLTNTDFFCRRWASNSLLKIDPEAAEKLGVRPETNRNRVLTDYNAMHRRRLAPHLINENQPK